MVCVVLLVLLVLLEAAVDSESTTSIGQDFVVVFPENIAYYYSTQPVHFVYITALHADTVVTVTHTYKSDDVHTLQAGEIRHVTLDHRLELRSTNVSDHVVHIASTKDVAVQAIGSKSNSVQSVLVLPTKHLGKRYIVPQLSSFNGAKHPLDNTIMPERSLQRVLVVNTDQVNSVTLEGMDRTSVLEPHEALQIYLDPDKALQAVTADKSVAVLLVHTCAMKHECTCGLLYTVLPPETTDQQTFLVPPDLAAGAENDSLIIMTDSESTNIMTYNPDSPTLSLTGSAIFYRPGFLLPLIAERDFASCFVVRGYQAPENFGVIVVHKDQTDGVRLGSDALGGPDWQQITGADYVSKKIPLVAGKNVLWHVSSTMGVYHMATAQDKSLFGNQAPSLSQTPDPRGCIVTPEGFEIGSVPGGWRESVSYCRGKNLELVGFPDAELKQHVHRRIAEEKENDLKRVWIGMRLGLRSGAWYWLDKKPLTEMDWSEEPDTERGQCVAMSVDEGFGWTAEHCCMEVNPVCYKEPVLFPL